MYDRRVSPFLCMQDLTSSSDVGRLYVEQKYGDCTRISQAVVPPSLVRLLHSLALVLQIL
jgi:hypothetical protein